MAKADLQFLDRHWTTLVLMFPWTLGSPQTPDIACHSEPACGQYMVFCSVLAASGKRDRERTGRERPRVSGCLRLVTFRGKRRLRAQRSELTRTAARCIERKVARASAANFRDL